MRIERFLNASPLFGLYSAYDLVMGDFQKRLRRENVHFLQALILTAIFFEERSIRPSELAETFRATRPNISHALRGLERAGLVERGTSDQDARAYLFSLTKDGRRKVARLIKIFDSTEDQIERGLEGKKVSPGLKLFVEIYKKIEVRI